MSKNKVIDIAGAALLVISLFLSWIGPMNGLDMIKGFLQHAKFADAWPFYLMALSVVGAVLLLIGSLVPSAASISGIGYFLAVSGFLVYIIKMLIESKGKIFDGGGTGFYVYLVGGVLLLIRPLIKSR